MSQIETDQAPRSHFLDLVDHGRYGAASSGSRRARRLALAIVEDVPGLDGEAIEGLKDFIDLVVAMPDTAREMVE